MMDKEWIISELKKIIDSGDNYKNATFYNLHTLLSDNDIDLDKMSYFFNFDNNFFKNEDSYILLGTLIKVDNELKKLFRDVYLKIETKIKEKFFKLFFKFFNSRSIIFFIDEFLKKYSQQNLQKDNNELFKYIEELINSFYLEDKDNNTNEWGNYFFIFLNNRTINNTKKIDKSILKEFIERSTFGFFLTNAQNISRSWNSRFKILSEKIMHKILQNQIGKFILFIKDLIIDFKYIFDTRNPNLNNTVINDFRNVGSNITIQNIKDEFLFDIFKILYKTNVAYDDYSPRSIFNEEFNNQSNKFNYWSVESNFFSILEFWRSLRNLSCHPSFFTNSLNFEGSAKRTFQDIRLDFKNKSNCEIIDDNNKIKYDFFDFFRYLGNNKYGSDNNWNSLLNDIIKIQKQDLINPSFYMLMPFYHTFMLKFMNIIHINNIEKIYCYKYNSNNKKVEIFYNSELKKMLLTYIDIKLKRIIDYTNSDLSIILTFPHSLLFKIGLASISLSNLSIADLFLNIFMILKKYFSINSWDSNEFFRKFKKNFLKITFINKDIYNKCLSFVKSIYEKRLSNLRSENSINKHNKYVLNSKKNFISYLKKQIKEVNKIINWSKKNF